MFLTFNAERLTRGISLYQNKRLVAPALAVIEPGTYRVRGGRSIH